MSSCAAVYLHGPLGRRFGERHAFAVKTPTEAIAALDANYPGFVAAFAEHEHYCIYADGDWREGAEAALLPFAREVHLCPVIEGRAFLGAALVGAIFPAIAETATASLIGGVLFAGLLIGVSFLLAPKVKTPDDTVKDENYAFTGPENVTGQGATVPLIYGRVHAGSVVVSAGLDLGTDLAATVPVAAAPTPANPNETGAVPPGGYPPIATDTYGQHPAGWILAGTTMVTSGNQFVKNVQIWQSPSSPTYFWDYVRGYYHGGGQFAVDSDYTAGTRGPGGGHG